MTTIDVFAHEVCDVSARGEDATGINNVENARQILSGDFYNLAGQRIAQPTKGLYIVNGKKVVIK